MAYYQNRPDPKKKKTNYGETGSWDEEGTHYRDSRGSGSRNPRSRRSFSNPSDRGDSRSEASNSRSRGHARPDDANKRNRGDSYPNHGKNPRRPGESAGSRRPPEKETLRADDRRSYAPAANERPLPGNPADYRDYEYRPPRRPGFSEEASSEDRLILCGRNPIREALKQERDLEKLLVQRGELTGSAREIVQIAKERKIMVQEVDKTRLDEIAPHHQGLIAFASAYQYAQVEDILAIAKQRGEKAFIILLDSVTDPHNLGAIIRTAECAGAHGIIVPQHRSVGLTPAAVKASAGAIEHIKVARVINLNRTIDLLHKNGIWVYAVTMDGTDFEKVSFQEGTALVIGAEGEGISRLTLEKCDMAVSLPMKGQLDSLNASVAAGIMMYRVLSTRRTV